MKDPRFIIIGGYIRSKADSDLHYISPRQLQRLYKLKNNECILAQDHNDHVLWSLNVHDFAGVLEPKSNGKYPLFEEESS